MGKRRGGFDTFSLSDYTITEFGEVINNRWNRKVKPQPNGKGYLRVHIAGKMRFVHRLVAEMYVPNPNNYPQVNHKDGNKTNNHASNLEWVTNSGNREHAVKNGLHIHGDKCPWAKLSSKKVEYIRQHPEISPKEFAKMYGVTPSAIRNARRGVTWKN